MDSEIFSTHVAEPDDRISPSDSRRCQCRLNAYREAVISLAYGVSVSPPTRATREPSWRYLNGQADLCVLGWLPVIGCLSQPEYRNFRQYVHTLKAEAACLNK